MLDALRKGAGTWVAKLFIALLVLSFAIWGVADMFQGFGQNVAARVGDTEISLASFDRAYRQDLNRFGQQFGRPLTPTEGAALGLPQQALGRLIAEAALNNSATNMSLGVSDERLATLIQADPSFQGPTGRYDRTRLNQVLRSNGLTEDQYVTQRREFAERQQLAEAISGGMKAPAAYVAALDAYQSETRDVSYLLLAPETADSIDDPAEDVLTAFFEENKADFRAPEYREIAMIELKPETLMRPDDIVEADALAEYERRADDFHLPERRKVRQMSFPSEDAAKEAAGRLGEGLSFDDLMAERNLTANDVNLGVMARADFLDEAIAEAAFSLEQGQTSGVVDGRFSYVVVNVEEILPEATKPFEEVRDTINADLAKEQAEREILDLLDEVEDARAGGAQLKEVSERFSLPLSSPEAFDATGKSAANEAVALPEAEGLVAGVFDSDIGVENDPLQLGDRGFLWYEVTKVTPARDRSLDEVKAEAIAAWKAQEITTRLEKRAGDLLEQAKTAPDLATLAGDAGLEVMTATGLKRNTPSSDFGRDAVAAVFSAPAGSSVTATAADASKRLVIRIGASSAPAFDAGSEAAAQLGTRLSQQVQDSLLGQYIADQEAKAGIEVNNAAITQILGTDRN